METEKTGVVYRIYHKESMKSYIGKSVRLTQRIREHFSGHRTSPVLRNAMKKHGAGAFNVEILESDVPESILSKLEILHIRFFNSKAPNGYNLTDGGEGASGLRQSPETRQKISNAHKGKTLSQEHRQQISECNKNRSLETRRKISEAHRGKNSPLSIARKCRKRSKVERCPLRLVGRYLKPPRVESHGIRVKQVSIQMRPVARFRKPRKVIHTTKAKRYLQNIGRSFQSRKKAKRILNLEKLHGTKAESIPLKPAERCLKPSKAEPCGTRAKLEITSTRQKPARKFLRQAKTEPRGIRVKRVSFLMKPVRRFLKRAKGGLLGIRAKNFHLNIASKSPSP